MEKLRQFRHDWKSLGTIKYTLKDMFTCGLGFHNLEDYEDTIFYPHVYTKRCWNCYRKFSK